LLGAHGSNQCAVSKIAFDLALSSMELQEGWRRNPSTQRKRFD
jgi:hypothetical protein